MRGDIAGAGQQIGHRVGSARYDETRRLTLFHTETRMPRHPKQRHADRRSAPRSPRAAVDLDPVARLRPLIQEGIIAAAALDARDDLEAAAVSMDRLGSLTSGIWRALSRELETASERLEFQVEERLADLERRSRALQVDV